MVAPYAGDPPGPQAQIEADGIYYGWQGLAANATFRANMSAIITNGMVAALTNVSVIAAHKQAITDALTDPAVIAAHKQAIKDALTDPALLGDWEALVADGASAGIQDAVNDLIAAKVIPNRADWGRAFALVALAATSVRRSVFMNDTSPQAYADLKARVTDAEVNVLD